MRSPCSCNATEILRSANSALMRCNAHLANHLLVSDSSTDKATMSHLQGAECSPINMIILVLSQILPTGGFTSLGSPYLPQFPHQQCNNPPILSQGPWGCPNPWGFASPTSNVAHKRRETVIPPGIYSLLLKMTTVGPIFRSLPGPRSHPLMRCISPSPCWYRLMPYQSTLLGDIQIYWNWPLS